MAVPALRDAEGTFGAVERATGPSSCAFAPWAEGCRGPGQRPGVVVLFTERFCSLDNQIRANSSISTESKDLPEAEVRLCQLSLARPCWPRANQGGLHCPKTTRGRGMERTAAHGCIPLSPPVPSAWREVTLSSTGWGYGAAVLRPRYGEGQSSAPQVTSSERTNPAAPVGRDVLPLWGHPCGTGSAQRDCGGDGDLRVGMRLQPGSKNGGMPGGSYRK